MNPKLHPAKHAVNSLRTVVDAIASFVLIMEDSHQHNKEIHISNNDCTQAYDAVPPWAMRAVYRYHGFPPDLIEMLMNMDTNHKGLVLTAHGAGTEWTMNWPRPRECTCTLKMESIPRTPYETSG